MRITAPVATVRGGGAGDENTRLLPADAARVITLRDCSPLPSPRIQSP
jgi:hypothetical protein